MLEYSIEDYERELDLPTVFQHIYSPPGGEVVVYEERVSSSQA